MTEDDTFERLKRIPIRDAFQVMSREIFGDEYNSYHHNLDSYVIGVIQKQEDKSRIDNWLINAYHKEKISYLTNWKYEEFHNAIVETIERSPAFKGWNNNIRPTPQNS